MNESDESFKGLLSHYLEEMCVTYGYCISRDDQEKLVHSTAWTDEADFVRALMLADGLTPDDFPDHFQKMKAKLSQLVAKHDRPGVQ